MVPLEAMGTITVKRAICATLANNVMGVVLQTSHTCELSRLSS